MALTLRASALALTAAMAIAAAAPASAAVTGTQTITLDDVGGGVYAKDFSAFVTGAGDYVFNIAFPVAGMGSLSYSSTVNTMRNGTQTGIAITKATLAGSPITLDATVKGTSTTYSGGGDIDIASATTLPLVISYTAASAGFITGNLTFSAVPEPASWALMIGGFGLVGGSMRRRSTKVAFANA